MKLEKFNLEINNYVKKIDVSIKILNLTFR